MGTTPNPIAFGTPPPPPGVAGAGQTLQAPAQPGQGPQLKPADLAKALIQKMFDGLGLLSKILVQAAPNALPMLEAATNNLGQVMSELSSGGPPEREGATAPPPPTPMQPPTGTAVSAAPPRGFQPGM
jgi:hypothetical protein